MSGRRNMERSGDPARPKKKSAYYQKFEEKAARSDPPQENTPAPDTPLSELDEPGRLHFIPSDELAKKPAQGSKQRGTRYAHKFTAEEEKASGTASRLHFTKDELPPPQQESKFHSSKTVTAAKGKADRADTKLEKARAKLPTRRRLRFAAGDSETGTPRFRLRFEKEVVPPPTHDLITGLAVGAAGALSSAEQSEDGQEDIGTQAGGTAGQTAQTLARQTSRLLYQHKAAPYKHVARLERQAEKANVNYLYKTELQNNPKLKSNPLSRMQQKRRIKKEYAKAAREAKHGASTVKESAIVSGKIARAVVSFFSAHKGAVAIGVIVVLLIFFMSSCMSSCSSMLMGGFSAAFVPAYKAEDGDIEKSTLKWTQGETELQEKIDNAERDHPGYDEYLYELDPIGHDPFQIIAFLSAMFDDFLYTDVSAVLQQVFDEVYTLEFIETVETRTRTNDDGEEEEYDWYILTTKLTTKDFVEVVRPMLDAAEHGDMFDIYMDSLGGHQKYGNPFSYEWLGNITCLYGYRENPTGAGTEIHRGLDIGAAEGTPLYAAVDGKVIEAGDRGDWGNTIIVEDDEGRQVRYAHCSALLATVGQKVKKGEEIAKVGNTGNSTGPHLHVEIKENGEYLNPLFMLNYTQKETDDD